ncbi:MAG: bifunctional folylpolyglutamate synthase/dihydrofolate synthase [Firmicutes bacterium]|nr:bifunctional folylpolyglutamate synthase/dihydrofolate synthase [Bacillota bacterium]MCM1400816.1 bifunctional folylpolyglutamate synthase/dihydrofolate synthase [Bacteroides sp.]MCM1476695.1 bifunctional folylpolyglutamate synthase/dihydrofolate synthase [Bacteroides sp.]
MNYKEAIDFLYGSFPAFHREGQGAYKPGLETVTRLLESFGSPHRSLRCIHVGGTNGKGSTAHTLAAILQSQGYKVGLFTSPHIIDFRERIRVNGEMIEEDEVVEFVRSYVNKDLGLSPSFFELTTAMAFNYFKKLAVDFAVIEVGLGGRLDSTNVITPLVSVITNISLDHTGLLGSTPKAIAAEKAGIIKAGVPVVIGKAAGGVKDVFLRQARDMNAPIVFASETDEIKNIQTDADSSVIYNTRSFGTLHGQLKGNYQRENALTVLETVKQINKLSAAEIDSDAVAEGFAHVCDLTGLMGRWMKIDNSPLTICDTGHNPGGWEYLSAQLSAVSGHKRIVVGFVNDKDVRRVLQLIATVPDASLYFTMPSTPRALPAGELQQLARECGLDGSCFDSVEQAYKKALADVVNKDSEMIFVGGSTFVVSDLLSCDCFNFH